MKVKQNLSLTNNFLYVDGRFYYGIAPSRQFPCKGCTERKVGCHATCERYLKAKRDHDHDVREELKHSNPGFSREREQKLRKNERDRRNR